MNVGGPRHGTLGVGLQRVLVGGHAREARPQDLVGKPPQVLDECQRQGAWPCPQLAHRQRSDPLIAVEEQFQLLALEAAVAVTDQLDGHRVDACAPEMLARGEGGQLPVVGPRQIAARVGDLRCDQMEVVEQPLATGRDEASGAYVGGECLVRALEDTGVVVEARQNASRTCARIDREGRGQRQRPIVEPLRAEQLIAEWPVR